MTAYEQIEALVDAYAGIHCAPTDLECIAAATAAHAALLAAVKALAEDADGWKREAEHLDRLKDETIEQLDEAQRLLKLCDSAMAWELGGEPLPTLMQEARKGVFLFFAARQSTVSAPAEPK